MARTKRRVDSDNCLDVTSKLETISERSDSLSANEDIKSEPKSVPKFDDKIYFIEVKTVGSVVRQPRSMQLAFASMRFRRFTPNWIKEEDVFEKEWSDSNKYLFIVDSFEDKIVEYLMTKKLRVIGPLTVLYCYSNECQKQFKTIPEKTFPVFSQCMRKLYVSISGFEGHKKQELITRITRMCGNYCKDFTKKVTHLVTDSVRTKKYRVAKENGIPVMSSLWVDICWNECQHNLLLANNKDIVDKYQIKIFYNLLITVSQVEVEERAVIKRLVEENGGEYSPSLKLAFNNTVLLLRTPEGQKFRYAYMRGIPCLNIQWLYDSIKKGYALPEDQYSIRSLSQTSDRCQQMLTQRQTIPTNDNQINAITTTNLSQTQDIRANNNVEITESTAINCVSKDINQTIVETITQSNAKSSDELFLEGCDVYLFGFETPAFENMRSALLNRGSMVYSEFKSIVTHVVVGPKYENSDIIQFFDKSSKVMSFEWVMECLRKNECCDCTPFEIKKPNIIENSESISSHQKRKRESDIFDGPLTVLNPKRVKKVTEKWENDSKNDSKYNHKSLGERLNQKMGVHWDNDEEDDIPSQRSYKEDSD